MRISLRRVRQGGIVLGALVVVAIVGYRMAGRSWIDAIYMVVITISTVGYGENSSLSPGEQIFTVFVIVIGISAAALTIGGTIQMMMEGEIARAMSRGRTSRAIEKLHGHVILCGYGRIGRTLAHELAARKTAFVVIDNKSAAIDEAQRRGYLVLLGDATEEVVLKSARVDRARTVVTALPNDASNVFITLTARNLNADLQIIARGEYQTTEKKLLQAGANRVVLPAAIGAMRMAAMITHPSTIEMMELVAGTNVLDVEVDEIVIPAASPMVGHSIAEVKTPSKSGLLVVAVKQDGQQMTFNPGAELVFQADDTIIVMGKQEDIVQFRKDYKL